MKLRNKLILSCAALAAVATTAVSTTYAWYTSNTEVTASNITGASANSGSELLLISQDQTKWGTSIADVIEDTSVELTPLAYVANTKASTDKTDNVLVGMTTNASKNVVTATAAADATGYLQFTLYLKNASTTAKALNMNIVSLTNTSTALPAKTVIGNGAQFIGLASSSTTYTVNTLRVLCMDLETYRTEDSGTTWTYLSEDSYDFENITETSVLDVSKVNGSTAADSLNGKSADEITATDETTYSAGNNYNAHQYYNSIMSPDSVIADPTADPTSFSGTITSSGKIAALVSSTNFKTAGTSATAGTYLKVVGKIFLNGWDLACFDAVQGQSFKLDISFDVKD